MIYTVTWSPSAEADLAELWMRAPDPAAFTRSANKVDAILKSDPYSHSESRSGEDRILLVAPVGILFKVSENDRKVKVFAVWRIHSSA